MAQPVAYPIRKLHKRMDRVLQAARVIALPPDRKIIHVIPRQYFVDGNENILDPVGMVGVKIRSRNTHCNYE